MIFMLLPRSHSFTLPPPHPQPLAPFSGLESVGPDAQEICIGSVRIPLEANPTQKIRVKFTIPRRPNIHLHPPSLQLGHQVAVIGRPIVRPPVVSDCYVTSHFDWRHRASAQVNRFCQLLCTKQQQRLSKQSMSVVRDNLSLLRS